MFSIRIQLYIILVSKKVLNGLVSLTVGMRSRLVVMSERIVNMSSDHACADPEAMWDCGVRTPWEITKLLASLDPYP